MQPRRYAVEIVDAGGTVLKTGQAHLTEVEGTGGRATRWTAEVILDPPYETRRWPSEPVVVRLVETPQHAGRGVITFPGAAIVVFAGLADSPPFWP